MAVIATASSLPRASRGSLSLRSVLAIAALTLAIVCPSVAYSDVVLREVDGGPEYYGQFSDPLPANPDFFPLGVWMESVRDQGNIGLDKDLGLNLYVAITRDSDLALVESKGMRVIPQQWEWRTSPEAQRSRAVAGWLLADEVDMQEGPTKGPIALRNVIRDLPSDGRMRFSNYGKGVMFWESDEEAANFVNHFQHVVSADVYWFTDPHVHQASQGGLRLTGTRRDLTPAETRRAANYGYTVDRMRALDAKDGQRRPVWNFVEVCWPWTETATQGARAILPAEVRAAVWHSIIAGARGIIYFNHSFGGSNISHHCLREPAYRAVRAAVKETNKLITQLAPVLNAPFADAFVSGGPSVRAMAKFHAGRYYIFAGSKENTASVPTFVLSGVNSGTVRVIGENRTIPIANGRFSDSFGDGNAIHIYEIDAS